ncbi:hypothetical protein SteCoe_17953 [Stentor coeruleus]|uniref:RING-CH-type domain-containing protein n=1 Tax=Stentor coeruleus TaxID=5963 RepID=A0A1R2BY39_9CILI|nr:hypothetical protein SteCoe_17953 [Stentor coeruleus]
MEGQSRKVCRICFEDETEEKKLISPCLCKGSSKYIHLDCLVMWITSQGRIKDAKKCEVCKYTFNTEVQKVKKCNPRDGMSKNPHFLCYLGILFVVTLILVILVYVILSKNYIDPKENIVYFIGILSIFVFSLTCSFVIIAKLIKHICFVDTKEVYRIFPLSGEDLELNTTNIIHSQPREVQGHYQPVQNAVDGNEVFIEQK